MPERWCDVVIGDEPTTVEPRPVLESCEFHGEVFALTSWRNFGDVLSVTHVGTGCRITLDGLNRDNWIELLEAKLRGFSVSHLREVIASSLSRIAAVPGLEVCPGIWEGGPADRPTSVQIEQPSLFGEEADRG